jgi:hypothetical protein
MGYKRLISIPLKEIRNPKRIGFQAGIWHQIKGRWVDEVSYFLAEKIK